MTSERRKALRQYVVYHLKLVELLHLFLLTMGLAEGSPVPENVMGHGPEPFRETLLNAVVVTFMTIADERSKNTHVKTIWRVIYPRHARAIERIWSRQVVPGVAVMKEYRDKAGAHGDDIQKYLDAKFRLQRERELVLASLDAFLRLSIRLTSKQEKENPTLDSEIEAVLLDVELGFSKGSFNRRWLRQMRLIPAGPFTRRFR